MSGFGSLGNVAEEALALLFLCDNAGTHKTPSHHLQEGERKSNHLAFDSLVRGPRHVQSSCESSQLVSGSHETEGSAYLQGRARACRTDDLER